jgi:hypothetical protein
VMLLLPSSPRIIYITGQPWACLRA